MNFQGQLDADVLLNLLQYLHLNRSSGLLRVQEARGSQGAIYTHAGQVVHAATGDVTGVDALVAVLRWRSGRFAFREGQVAPVRTIEAPLDALLLQIAHRTDEDDRGTIVVDAETVLTSQEPEGAEAGSVALSRDAVRLLTMLDGRSSLGALAERARVPHERVMAAARELVENGLAEASAGAMVEAEVLHNLTALLRDIMGPLADIVMDEVLDDLGVTTSTVPVRQVSVLVERLDRELERDDWRAEFRARSAPLLERYGIRP